MGRMAGPLNPPMPLEILGRRDSTSITIARNVLTSDTAELLGERASLSDSIYIQSD